MQNLNFLFNFNPSLLPSLNVQTPDTQEINQKRIIHFFVEF